MSQQRSIDPSIKFYHVMHPDGTDGITIGYRRRADQIEFSIFEQNGYPKRGYNKRIGREATSGRLAKGKFQAFTLKEGVLTIAQVLQQAFNFWTTRASHPLDMMYIHKLFNLHYDKVTKFEDVVGEVPDVLH